ncbi:MAG: translation initiation factor IF-2 [Patescibacteria group bacterium]
MAKKAPAHKASGATSTRPPVVVIMGHIDHGKSTLLDYIRKSNIVAGEAGGITQHLGAYEVPHGDGKITFLDTPGHEAFSKIRQRGAKVADVAVLVVSAEDGVKQQTLEALKSILEVKIPYIVAINKIDKPGADVERTKQSLAENEIYVEGYGGDVPVVPISALKGTGISELLDMVILVTEMSDLKATASVTATGTIIEANLDAKKGISATLLITNGTLSSGMFVVSEDAVSPVRIFEDFKGVAIKSASFSSPVRVIGFNKVPNVGAGFVSCSNKTEAEEMANAYKLASKNAPKEVRREAEGTIIIPVIIKADVIGSLDGIKQELAKIKHEKVVLKIVSEGIGNISETDVKTAQGDPNITIISFNAPPDSKARNLLERTTVKVEQFDIIYKLIEYVKDALTVRIPKEYISEITGTAKILALFSKVKDRQILGGKVQTGSISVGAEVKIIRRENEIGVGKIKELQQQKAKTSEVREGYEFGAMIESKVEMAEGDKIQCFVVVEKKG